VIKGLCNALREVGKLPQALCSQLWQAQLLLGSRSRSCSSCVMLLLLLLPLLLLPLCSLLSNWYNRVCRLLNLPVRCCLLLLVVYLPCLLCLLLLLLLFAATPVVLLCWFGHGCPRAI
jgi:hypothetical protein